MHISLFFCNFVPEKLNKNKSLYEDEKNTLCNLRSDTLSST